MSRHSYEIIAESGWRRRNPFNPFTNPKEYRNWETVNALGDLAERYPKASGTALGGVIGSNAGLAGARMYNNHRMKKLIKKKASKKEIELEKDAAVTREKIGAGAGAVIGGAGGYALGRAVSNSKKKDNQN